MAAPSKYNLKDISGNGWGFELDFCEWDTEVIIQWICVLDEDFGDDYEDKFNIQSITGVHFKSNQLGNEEWCQSELGMDSQTAISFSSVVRQRINKHNNIEYHPQSENHAQLPNINELSISKNNINNDNNDNNNDIYNQKQIKVSKPPQTNTTFKLHIAIDFGTDGLGLAYAIDDDVFVHSKWNSERYRDVIKPKTIILLDKNGTAEQFGLDAKEVYMKLASKKDHMLFERFKMALYEEQIQDLVDNKQNEVNIMNRKINIKTHLIADNGTSFSCESVFVQAFKYIQKESKRFLRKQKIKAKKHEIQWIITVPAIWSDKAKNKMREWIIKAGLVDENNTHQCKVVFEPDCASLMIRKEIKKTKYYGDEGDDIGEEDIDSKKEDLTTATFSKNEKFILIDAGGGTVDVACHEIIDESSVSEILPPSGGPWGSCYIDDKYKLILNEIFGEELMSEFKIKHANIYMQIIHNFQHAKKTFNGKEKKHNCRLPCDFIAFIEDKFEHDNDHDFDIEQMVTNCSVMGQSNLVILEDEILEINTFVWISMFDHVINPIISHIKTLLKSQLLIRCQYLCLVGGLSCSPYFQLKMKYEFEERYKLQIIIPKRPILCVVQGAAYFGIVDNYVKARRLRGTYGISMSFAHWKARSYGISEEYIKRKLDNTKRVHGCFEIVAKRKDLIHTNQILPYTVYCLSRESSVTILYSNKENPKTIEDGEILAKIKIDNGPNWRGTKAIIEFHFYDTTLKVYAYPSHMKQAKESVTVIYQ